MRAMYKSELAAYAGVSTGTLRRWLMPYRQELNEIGVKPKDQLLSPKAVKFICISCLSISNNVEQHALEKPYLRSVNQNKRDCSSL